MPCFYLCGSGAFIKVQPGSSMVQPLKESPFTLAGIAATAMIKSTSNEFRLGATPTDTGVCSMGDLGEPRCCRFTRVWTSGGPDDRRVTLDIIRDRFTVF